MAINLSDELHAATTKGKLAAAKEVYLEGDAKSVQKAIDEHSSQLSKHESDLIDTGNRLTKQEAYSEQQTQMNTELEENMAKLNDRDDQIVETMKGITATGGASTAESVSYNNSSSKLSALHVQRAIDEVKGLVDNIQTTTDQIRMMEVEGYILAFTDSNDTFLGGITTSGLWYIPKGIPEESRKLLESLQTQIDEITYQRDSIYTIDENGTYLLAIKDQKGICLGGITKEGKWDIPNGIPAETKEHLDAIYKALQEVNDTINTKDGECKSQIEEVKDSINAEIEERASLIRKDNSSFAWAVADKEGNVWLAGDLEGNVTMPKGIPDEVKVILNDVTQRLEALESIIKTPSTDGNFLAALVDASGNELLSISKEGEVTVSGDLKSLNGYSVKVVEAENGTANNLYTILDANDKVVLNITKEGKMELTGGLSLDNGSTGINVQDTEGGWLFAILDAEGKVLGGFKKDGEFYANSVDINGIPSEEDNDQFLYAIKDQEDHILWGIFKSGAVYQPSGVPVEVEKELDSIKSSIDELAEKVDNTEVQEIDNKFLDKVMLYGNAGRGYLGNVALQEPGTTDYCIIMMYGQSLSNGSENPAGFNDDVVDGCYMLGSNVWTTTGSTLKALSVGGTVRSDGVATGTRQDTIVSTVNTFVSLYRKERPWDKNTKFIACSMGVGGRTVAQLSGNKYADGNNSTRRYPNCNEKWLETNVRTFFQSVKAIADAEGKTISLSAVFWKQGESDYGTGYIGKSYDEWKAIQDAKTTTDSNAMQGSKDAYKKGLTILKEDIFALAKEIFGDDQVNRPVFMPYSVCGTYINNAYQTINDATYEMANEQDDVVQVGPTYVTPDYNGGHLAMNGYRWFGEYCAKALYYVYLKHMDFRPLQPESFEVKDNKVYVYINPIVPPLRIDKYTPGDTYKNLGFSVRMGTVTQLDNWKSMTSGGLQVITDITISENCIILTCGNIEKFEGAVEVSYAGQGESGYGGHNQGAGNIRDCDAWQSKYLYREDSADHGSRNGNWTGSTKATDEEKQTLQYWDSTYASSTGYSKDDKVLFDFIEYDGPVVITSAVDNNKSLPANPVNYHTTDVKGNTIVGKNYPMQNWLLNFYKRIVL